MHHALIWITFVLFYDSFIHGAPNIDWNKELDDISSKLSEISNKLVVDVQRISLKVDTLNEKLDGISREMESQKSSVGDMKKSLEHSSGICSSGKDEIVKLTNKIESYSQKQLKDQQFTKDALNSQKIQLAEIKNLTVTGFSKTLEKLIIVTNQEELLSDISKGVQKLAAVYTRQEVKLNTIQDTLQQTTDSIGRARDSKADELELLWKNVSTALNEQSKPLSSAAVSHVNRAVTITDTAINGINMLKDLEPKLVHAVRLSEDMRKSLAANDLSPIANNLTNSLKALETSTPLIVSSVSKNVNDIEVVLRGLKAMSKHNDCPFDLTSDIRDHHNEIIKYLNSTKVSSRVDQNIDDEVWKTVMKKLENIETNSEANVSIYDRLTKLREDIGGVRKSIQDHFGESEPNEDVVFG